MFGGTQPSLPGANDDDGDCEDGGKGGGGDDNDGGEGEGASARRQSRGEYWICDAIDGAVMFVRAIPNWAMSLTLVRDGEAVFAAVYDALHDETFHALAGGGAFRNGKAMRVNDKGSHYHGGSWRRREHGAVREHRRQRAASSR
ncbi:Inositol monophosphatase family protein [Rugamonas rubra]|uniref:Inositol monophosphatase family protein n=2 Tax=Rugamonas rubra TaxID=758825 RepID=A0A1I4NIF1_9BURK|nr:Inositol monophosphatase family protein [Rugamonas rubra]